MNTTLPEAPLNSGFAMGRDCESVPLPFFNILPKIRRVYPVVGSFRDRIHFLQRGIDLYREKAVTT